LAVAVAVVETTLPLTDSMVGVVVAVLHRMALQVVAVVVQGKVHIK
jgi:hypothetical protein